MLQSPRKLCVIQYHRKISSLIRVCGISQASCALPSENDKKPTYDAETKLSADVTGDIRSLCETGKMIEALRLLQKMDRAGIRPDCSTYSVLVQGCTLARSSAIGKHIYKHMKVCGFRADVLILTKLLTLFVRHGSLADAQQLFDEMSERNVISWNVMLGAYANRGQHGKAMKLLCEMQRSGIKVNQHVFTTVLKACSSPQFANFAALQHGRQIHALMLKSGFNEESILLTALLLMYAKRGIIEDAGKVFDDISKRDIVSWNGMATGYVGNRYIENAREVFEQMPLRNVVSWNILIAGFVKKGYTEEGLHYFKQMLQSGIRADHFTHSSVLGACADLRALAYGKQFHAQVIKSGTELDLVVMNALIDMYAKCRYIDDAERFFVRIPDKDIVSWDAIAAGYANCENLRAAQQVFDQISEKNVISWTSLMFGYVDRMQWQEGLALFYQMHSSGIKPNEVACESILHACCGFTALEEAQQVHSLLSKCGYEQDLTLANLLIDAYSKSGSIEAARSLFDSMPFRDTSSWNAIIVGYVQNGFSKEAIELFESMQFSGTVPDSLTFLGVLSACSHAELEDKFLAYLESMNTEYNIQYTADHYACMVDLLGRLGRLQEAYDLVKELSCHSVAKVWEALLRACRIHLDFSLGKLVAEKLLMLNPQSLLPYIVLAKIYTFNGMLEEASTYKKLMDERGLHVVPACSKIIDKHVRHLFLTGDRSHAQIEVIDATLKNLGERMKDVGYATHANLILHDINEESDHTVGHHSEALAMVFGMISMPTSVPIKVIKNIRVCANCHSLAKFISKFYEREIHLIDMTHVHRFKDGVCSCGDYW